MVDKIRKEDAEAGKFLYLASTTANFLSVPTVHGFREKRDTEITDLDNNCMNGVRDILAQADSAPTGLYSWVAQLENSDAGKRLLVAANHDNVNYGDGSVPSGGGST